MENIGLSAIEAKIYLAALELGQASPMRLAEKARVKRPTLYKVLPNLFDKGLLAETKAGKRRLLVAEDPESYLDKKRGELIQFEQTLPELRSLLNTASVKPVVNFYEGIEGIKKVYLDNLRVGQAILEFLSLQKIDEEIEDYCTGFYIRERIRRRIPIKIIISGPMVYGKFNLENNERALRETKNISAQPFPMPIDAYIYGDNLSFMVYRSDSEPAAIIIRSKEIATAMRSLFNLAWASNL